jgi:hypothetical protein
MHNLSHPVAFELIAIPEGIIVQVCAAHRDRTQVLDSLRAFFPEIRIREHDELLAREWENAQGYQAIIDFGLSELSIRSLKKGPRLETDPLIGIVGAMNDLDKGELGLLQVLFTPAVAPWGADLWNVASANPAFSSLLPLIREKFGDSVQAAVIRVATVSPRSGGAIERARRIGNSLIASTQSELNSLIPLSNDGYPADIHAEDVVQRETHRSGMLLSQAELLSLVHPPAASVRSSNFKRQSEKTRAAPRIARGHDFTLGENEHDGDECAVGLSVEQRLKHTYIIGASGTGKSTLMLSMIRQDLEAGRGVAVLDPHGDLVDDVLARIPDHRLSDVVLIDPADEEYPVGFNILSAHSETERILLSSDLVGVFKRLSTSWGDQMTSVLGNAILAFLESNLGGTLLDLRRFLVDAGFRKRFLATVRDPEIVYFWEKEFTLLRGTPQAPLLTRLDTFLRPKLIRYMVAQKEDRLDLRAMMDDNKILLAKLSQGAIGEENSHLLGSLLVARINQAAMSRQERPKQSRTPFFLYLDEFHNFVTPSIASILSGARKYGLGLVLAHQDMRQIRSRSEDVASAALGNAYTRVVFRVGEHDARSLADGFSFFEARDLQNLGVGDAVARIEQAVFDFSFHTTQVPEVDADLAELRRAAARDESRQNVATARQEVEEVLRAQRPSEPQAPTPDRLRKAKVVPDEETSRADTSVGHPRSSDAVRDRAMAATPGRGGPQHKYLQSLIKRAAEDRGLRATVEKTVLDGHGHVDVALEREGLSIACEISISTDVEHELGNLSKCMAAGFDYAVLICSDKKILSAAHAEFTAELSEAQRERVRFLTPEALLAFLDEVIARSASTTSAVRGYKVNTRYTAATNEERDRRERMLADVISKSLKRAKK